MPKDEFDFDDPMELNGVGLMCAEDTTDAMTECFVEEFMRLGHNAKQILAMFRNPHYIGMNLALEQRGEQFVRDTISEVFARWGRVVTWPGAPGIPLNPALNPDRSAGLQPALDDASPTLNTVAPERDGHCGDNGAPSEHHPPLPCLPCLPSDPTLTDPMGVPIPKLNT